MPTSCEPSELVENARQLDCCIPKGLQSAVLILLFGELVTMPVDVDTLLADAKCIDQCIPDGAKMSVLISLACQLVAQGGTGGGSTNSIDYAGPPVLNPPDISAIVVDSNGRQWMYWGGTWN